MDTIPAHGHVYEEEAPRLGVHSGGEEEHHEKKSVLKKVKDKAKKIKETISKKKHGHGEEHPPCLSSEEEEEEEEGGYAEDDEREEEQEVHAAPKEDPGAPKAGAGEGAVPGSYQIGVVSSPSPGGPEPEVIRSFQALSVSDRPAKDKAGREKTQEEASAPAHVEETSGTTQAVSGQAEQERREAKEQQQHGEKSYPKKISSVIVDKAAQAKAAAVSAAAGSAEYGKKIAETVYEKVAGARLVSAVASNVSPPQQQQQQPPEEQKEQQQRQEEGPSAGAEGGGAGKARRVSMRAYLAEKLSPGEEDRALSEIISEAMQKRKEEQRDVREEEAEEKATAATTPPGEKKAGKGVVGKIKGAVTSLFGPGGLTLIRRRREERPRILPGSSRKQTGGSRSPATDQVPAVAA